MQPHQEWLLGAFFPIGYRLPDESLNLRVGYAIKSFILVYTIFYNYNASRSFDQLDVAVFECTGC